VTEPETPSDPLPSRADVVILGAGPAGLFAAIEAAAAPGVSVLVLERRPFAGGMVPVAGGGRCNVTNAGSVGDLMAGFGRDGRWLETALRRLDNVTTIRWFESRGVPMKEEEGGKMFPLSDDGADVQRALIREAERQRARIALRSRLESALLEGNRVTGVVANGSPIACEALVIAGGGGGPKPTPTSGVGLAKALGHVLVPPAPALAPIKLTGRPLEHLSGFSLRKPRVAKTGELLFTHFGLSGPVVLDLSHPIARLAAREPAEISIDLLPEVDDARAEIDRACREEGGRAAKNSLLPQLPRRLVEHLLKAASLDPERRASELRSSERGALAQLAKDLRFSAFEVTWAGAMVTAGGVALSDVDPKTMASRRVRGLYLAGECLDLQGDCGGYNLQASFSTGALAGESAARHALAQRAGAAAAGS
jgi:predicted Rossmann fold flavoprotein